MFIQNDFMPTTASGWATLIATSLGLFTLFSGWALKFIRAPLLLDIKEVRKEAESKAKEHGERIGKVETACERNEVAVAQVEKAQDLLTLQFMTMTKSVERVDTHVQELLNQGRTNHESGLQQISNILQRLARIETSLSLPQRDSPP